MEMESGSHKRWSSKRRNSKRRNPRVLRARKFRIATHLICACHRLCLLRGSIRIQPVAPAPDIYGGPDSHITHLLQPHAQPPDEFGVVAADLVKLLEDRDSLEYLDNLGGIEGLSAKLQTDCEYGLDETEEQMQRRRHAYGANTYPKKKSKRFWSFAWDACKDTTLNILMACAVVSLATGIWTEGIQKGWYEGTSIAFAVILVIIVTAVSDYKQGLNFQNLNAEKENIQLEVLRAGRRQTVSIFDLVVGDIVPLSIGGQVPADGVLVECHSLSIDESTMTGESLPVKKDKSRPFLLSGCKVQDGQGTMLVTGVGQNTTWGKVMASISADNGEQTPLQVRLNGAATLIGKVGLFVAMVVLIILIARYFAITFKNALPKDRRAVQVIKDMVHIFSIAVIIVVVAVPEGLPLAVTLTLAYSMRKMMADKSLVRVLAACETMGSATTICSDKTGTLTTNKMTVTKVCLAGELKSEDSLGNADSLPANLRNYLVNSTCLNSNGNVSPPRSGEEQVVTGSPTEAAILTWGLQLGMDFRVIRQDNEVLHMETFNSEKKRAGVVYKNVDGEFQLHWKGAAEIILDLCTEWIDSNGERQRMTEEKRREFGVITEGMAAQALRCIAFAFRNFQESEIPQSEEARSEWMLPDDELCLMAIAGIKDPCRDGVRDAVEKCQKAGVKVRMVTGDNVYTAKAIAAECGILTNGGLVVEGKDFRNWDEGKLNSSDLDNIVVMARSSPLDKLKLVKALKNRGEVVAVTGDGTNDAPALKESDIGLSMGIAGTEVAKESSDIIILDDNFTSVVKVVRWGRSVYANIQKFIQFQLTVNVVALAINFVAAVSSGEVPLTAVQLLWVNLIMDTLGALALATESPTDDLMDRKPVGRTEPLITNIMWRNIFGQAIYQIVVLLLLTYRGIEILGLKGTHSQQVLERNTIIFNAFVFCQLFNEINARRPESFNVFQEIYRNYLFMGIIGITVFIQVIIVTFLNNFADTTMLAIKWWGLCIAIGSIALPLAVLVKCIPVPKKPLLEISCFPSTSCLRLKRRNRPNPYDSDNESSASTRIGSSRQTVGSRRHISNVQLRSGRIQELEPGSNVITIHS